MRGVIETATVEEPTIESVPHLDKEALLRREMIAADQNDSPWSFVSCAKLYDSFLLRIMDREVETLVVALLSFAPDKAAEELNRRLLSLLRGRRIFAHLELSEAILRCCQMWRKRIPPLNRHNSPMRRMEILKKNRSLERCIAHLRL